MRLIQCGVPSPEECDYLYDGGGALMTSTFAMTPKTGFTPTGTNPWYDPSDLASSRARVVYDNFSGENFNLYYYWDNWSSGGSDYTSQDITGFNYAYNSTSMLKTGATFLDGSGTSWLTDHNEAYSYDSNLEYLTEADYNVGGTGDTPETWSYDVAGNRLTDSANPGTWTYDNLNRMSASPGLTYSNDILGNRLSNSISGNTWDQRSRLIGFSSGGDSTTTNYSYRLDGLRVQKSVNGGASTTYAYDGQVGFEDVDSGPTASATDYAIGGRILDRIAKTVSGVTTVAYPIYDGHGNMVSTLSESGSSYATGNQRSYDAWGNILNSDGTGDPKGRYCANIGHKQDDESGLIYMRARYYDANSGRFISEDPERQGTNWSIYCSNRPTVAVDASGCDTPLGTGALIAAALLLATLAVAALVWAPDARAVAAALALVALSVVCFSRALGGVGKEDPSPNMNWVMGILGGAAAIIAIFGKTSMANAVAYVAIAACFVYDCELAGALWGALN